MAESRAAGGWEEGPHCPLGPLWNTSTKQPREGFPIAVCSKQMPLPSCHSAGRVSRRHGYGFPVRGKRFLRNRLAFVRENVTDRQFCLFPVAAGKLTAKSAVHPPGGAGLDRATCDSLLPRRGCFARGTSREDQCLTSAGLVGAAH